MGQIPDTFEETILLIAERLKDNQYAIRGTASLVLQGLDMNVDDIDIICDKETALLCNEKFSEYRIQEIEYSESDQFKSWFGKFRIYKIVVEVMGEWEIKRTAVSKLQTANRKQVTINSVQQAASGEERSKRYDASSDQITIVRLKGVDINVTKIETELEMFMEMGRWSAYHKIRKQIKADPKQIEAATGQQSLL